MEARAFLGWAYPTGKHRFSLSARRKETSALAIASITPCKTGGQLPEG